MVYTKSLKSKRSADKMDDILIRNIPRHIISKIDEDWKNQNYKSRNEYLNKQLELMISLEPLKKMEDNYTCLLYTSPSPRD